MSDLVVVAFPSEAKAEEVGGKVLQTSFDQARENALREAIAAAAVLPAHREPAVSRAALSFLTAACSCQS